MWIHCEHANEHTLQQGKDKDKDKDKVKVKVKVCAKVSLRVGLRQDLECLRSARRLMSELSCLNLSSNRRASSCKRSNEMV